MENRIVLTDKWAHICPKCGAYCDCYGEERTYKGNTAELVECYSCADCEITFAIVSEINYKYHIVDEE